MEEKEKVKLKSSQNQLEFQPTFEKMKNEENEFCLVVFTSGSIKFIWRHYVTS